MSSNSENSSSDSNSNSNSSSNSTEYREWESRVLQCNIYPDLILDEVIINDHYLALQEGQPSRARRVHRESGREKGHAQLMKDYFVDNPTYDQYLFRRRFRTYKHLFCRIVDVVVADIPYFQQRPDATCRPCFSPLQKCISAMRVMTYGTSYDAIDEYMWMSEVVVRKSLMMFVSGVNLCFNDEYLRKPNENDLVRPLYVGDQRGFPDMIGSIDCVRWQWKNCPTAWAGQYAGKSGKPTIILEAVASYDLWIWHTFFGTPGLSNDINVLHRSLVFDDILTCKSPKVNYVVNNHQKNMAYYLTGVIYLS